MIYDSATHTYWNGDTELPSVSAVLKMCPVPFFLNKYIASGKKYEGLEMAANLGTDTHTEVGKILEGGVYTPAPTARGILIGKMVDYAKSVIDKGKVVGFEQPMISRIFNFGGTPDMWALHDDTEMVLHDWKTNQKTKSAFKPLLKKYEAQLGAYATLLQEHGVSVNMGFVHHLPDKSSYEIDLTRGVENFFTLLGVYYGAEEAGVKAKDVIGMWNNGMTVDAIDKVFGIGREEINKILKKYSIL